MNTKKRNQIIIIAIVVVIVAIILGIVVNRIIATQKTKSNDNAVVTTPKTLTEDKKYGDLIFSDIEVISTEELNHIALNITNNSEVAFKQQFVKITFKKQNGEVIDTVEAIIPDIDGKGSSRLDMVVNKEVLTAYTFTIEKLQTE